MFGLRLEAFALVFTRLSTVLFLLPGFGERALSMRIKVYIALVLAAVFTPIFDIPADADVSVGSFGNEFLVGLTLGLAARSFIWVLQIAGSIAAQATSLSQLFGGAAIDPSPAMGQLFMLSGLTLFFVADLHLVSMVYIDRSYILFPIGVPMSFAALGDWSTSHISFVFALSFALAAPFVFLALLYNLALGVINKAMPQLMVAFVGAPLITLGGIVVFALAVPIALVKWKSVFETFLNSGLGSM